jgi:hypothetical protein
MFPNMVHTGSRLNVPKILAAFPGLKSPYNLAGWFADGAVGLINIVVSARCFFILPRYSVIFTVLGLLISNLIFSPTNPCEEATIRRNVDKTKETICSCLVKLALSQLRRPSRTPQRSISSPVSTKVNVRKRGN